MTAWQSLSTKLNHVEQGLQCGETNKMLLFFTFILLKAEKKPTRSLPCCTASLLEGKNCRQQDIVVWSSHGKQKDRDQKRMVKTRNPRRHCTDPFSCTVPWEEEFQRQMYFVNKFLYAQTLPVFILYMYAGPAV